MMRIPKVLHNRARTLKKMANDLTTGFDWATSDEGLEFWHLMHTFLTTRAQELDAEAYRITGSGAKS